MSREAMDRKVKNHIISQLRMISLRWSVRNEVLSEAKIYSKRYKKDGSVSKKPSVTYQCAKCKKRLFKRNEVDVDHINPVGPFLGSWDHYVAKLFCSKSNLQVLCREICHKRKTKKGGK